MLARYSWSAVALLALAGTLWGDIPPGPSPRHDLAPLPEQFAKPEPRPARVVIFLNEDWDKGLPEEQKGQPRLRFPIGMLAQQHVAAPALEEERPARQMMPRSTLLIGGMALTMSFALSGLWLARGKNKRWLGGGLLLVAIVVGGVSGCPDEDLSFHDVAYDVPEKLGRLQPGKDGSESGRALLERDDSIDSIQLVVDREDLKAVCDSLNKTP